MGVCVIVNTNKLALMDEIGALTFDIRSIVVSVFAPLSQDTVAIALTGCDTDAVAVAAGMSVSVVVTFPSAAVTANWTVGHFISHWPVTLLYVLTPALLTNMHAGGVEGAAASVRADAAGMCAAPVRRIVDRVPRASTSSRPCCEVVAYGAVVSALTDRVWKCPSGMDTSALTSVGSARTIGFRSDFKRVMVDVSPALFFTTKITVGNLADSAPPMNARASL